jgi:hypothetical protein
MKVYLENIYHFTCDSCNLWWSIGDFPFGMFKSLFCPYCGVTNKLDEQVQTGENFSSGNGG